MAGLRDCFMLDPKIAYLNHGGFGAVPRPVMDVRLRILNDLEANPTRSYMRELDDKLAGALASLALSLGCRQDQVAFMSNATTGLNLIARSLLPTFEPGDEVLVTDLEYGAQQTLWQWASGERGVICRTIRLLGRTPDEMTGAVEEALTPATRMVLLSHISSSTALRLPLPEICGRLRHRGVLSVIDGAHAPGQVPLDLGSVGADFYVGNLHKWFAAPRPAGFIHAEPTAQSMLDPLVVNWGGTDRTTPLAIRTNRPGTADCSQWLAVPEAMAFHATHLVPARPDARHRLEEAARALAELDYERVGTVDDDLMMSSFWLPAGLESDTLRARLLAADIEAIAQEHDGRPFLRICVAWYTTDEEIERLLDVCRSVHRRAAASAS